MRILRCYPGQWQVRGGAGLGAMQRRATGGSAGPTDPGASAGAISCERFSLLSRPQHSAAQRSTAQRSDTAKTATHSVVPLLCMWQVHYVPPNPREATVLLSCEDGKPTFQRLIELLKGIQGSR